MGGELNLLTMRMLFVLLCFALMCVSCRQDSSRQVIEQEANLFQPTEEFSAGYEPIENALKAKDLYDIEKTVQVMYALEQLQSKAVTLEDFLLGMAKLKQNGVAEDILKSEERLLSILQEMRQIEQDAGEQEKITLYHSIINVIRQTNQSLDTEKTVVASGDMMALVSIVGKEMVTQACDELDQYLDKCNVQNKELREKINNIEKRYMDFLASYNSICEKYMKKWDGLCLDKDQAYLDIYNGNFSNALKLTHDILSKYPTNREAMLLNALSATMLGMRALPYEVIHLSPLAVNDFKDSPVISEFNDAQSNNYFAQASMALEKYMELYPDYSAPALVLKGIIALCHNQEDDGISLLGKASIEYPKQSEKLSEMFELYSSRSYLNKTNEGKYVLMLYRSTMEGYGIFSPNFIKAGYYTQCGRDEDSRKEIFNHFFRRGNQGIYHCLLSDMQFCEQFIGGSFHRMLPENSFFDIETSKALFESNKIKVTFNNRTNISLQNVRIFLCLHLTDMYPNEYEILKLQTKNLVPAMERTIFDPVEFNYEGKTYDDIAHMRAIVMTDDSIFWVDDVDYKLSASQNGASVLQPRSDERIDRNLLLTGFDKQSLEAMTENISPMLIAPKENNGGFKKLTAKLSSLINSDIEAKWSNTDGKLKFEIPRKLMLLAPSFSLKLKSGKLIKPEISYINDLKIRLLFDFSPSNKEKCALYIYTKNASCRLIYECEDKEMWLLKNTIF